MQVPADDRGSGFEELRRAAPVPPSTHGGATSRSGELNDGPSPNPGGPSRSAQEREKLDEKLFSEDPRKQYAAFKELSESAKTITKAQYDRIHDIRWATPHLALAELGEKLLREKRSCGPASTDTQREILTLIRQCDQQYRERLLKAMQEDPAIGFRQAVLRRGLVAAALAGFLLGSGLAYLLLPKGRTPDSGRAEAYVDTRTGQLISTSSQSEKQLAAALSRGDCQPAFYCWKCRQWLPVKNPEQQVTTVAGPIRAIHRPIIPGPKTP